MCLIIGELLVLKSSCLKEVLGWKILNVCLGHGLIILLMDVTDERSIDHLLLSLNLQTDELHE